MNRNVTLTQTIKTSTSFTDDDIATLIAEHLRTKHGDDVVAGDVKFTYSSGYLSGAVVQYTETTEVPE